MTSPTLETRTALGTTVLRVVVGIIFFAHGAQKLFQIGPEGVAGFFGSIGIPFPLVNAYLVTGIEFLGGLALVAGAGTRILAALFAAITAVAIATFHGPQGFFMPNGYEFVLVLLAASLTLVLQGAGAYALDNVAVGLRGRARRPLAEARA